MGDQVLLKNILACVINADDGLPNTLKVRERKEYSNKLIYVTMGNVVIFFLEMLENTSMR